MNTPTNSEALTPTTGSESAVLAAARAAELERRLKTLATWATARAMGNHDTETTLTMLEKRVGEIAHGVNRAGWRALDEYHANFPPVGLPNAKESHAAYGND